MRNDFTQVYTKVARTVSTVYSLNNLAESRRIWRYRSILLPFHAAQATDKLHADPIHANRRGNQKRGIRPVMPNNLLRMPRKRNEHFIASIVFCTNCCSSL